MYMKLWTVQPLSILEEINETGVYRCREELSYNLSKKNSLKKQYQWLINKMEQRIGNRPQGVEYPVWAWHTWDFERRCPDADSAAFLERTEDKVLLTLEIPDESVVLTDFDAWQLVMSGAYLTNETDENKLEAQEDYLVSLEGEALQQAIEQSWELVFDTTKIDTEKLQWGRYIQATIWQIRAEDIVEMQVLRTE